MQDMDNQLTGKAVQKKLRQAETMVPDSGHDIRSMEIRQLLAQSEISICLKSYDDIFSSFDPRPYSERALSDDFLMESRRAARDKNKGIQLKFLVPGNTRHSAVEARIRKRLRQHFRKHFGEYEQESKKILVRSVFAAGFGFALMTAATFMYDIPDMSFFLKFLRVIIEPAGWFTVWFSLDQIFYSRKEKKGDLDFYGKMSKATISFTSY
jgi:hypothetical protein